MTGMRLEACDYEEVVPVMEQGTFARLRRRGCRAPTERLQAYTRRLYTGTNAPLLIVARDRDDGMVLGGIALAAAAWDSERCGVGVWKVHSLALSEGVGSADRCSIAVALAEAAVSRARREGAVLLMGRTALRTPEATRALEEVGFRLMDVQCTLAIDLGERAPYGGALSDARPEDLPRILSFASSMFRHSHLSVDDRLPGERVVALHEAWIRNDFSGRAAFVSVIHSSGRVAGFIAGMMDQTEAELLDWRQGMIDLIAVEESERGRGLGRRLVDDSLRRFEELRVDTVTVGTQVNNVEAIRAYLNCGFKPADYEATLHLWLKH